MTDISHFPLIVTTDTTGTIAVSNDANPDDVRSFKVRSGVALPPSIFVSVPQSKHERYADDYAGPKYTGLTDGWTITAWDVAQA